LKRHLNYHLLALITILTVGGLLFLSTLSAPASLKIFGNPNYYFFRQTISVLIGLVLFLILLKLPLHIIKKIAPILLIINAILLVLVFIPVVGAEFWGAKRWINIGGKTIQPSEFLKLTSILYVSSLISTRFSKSPKRGNINISRKSGNNFIEVFLPFFILLGIIALFLVFQRDLGTLGIIIVALLTIYLLADTPLWHTILSASIMILGAVSLIALEPYRVKRFLVFLNPEIDPLGIGFQLRQSLIAIGSGGIFGNGLGMSTQKFGFLPQAMSDSIFAILGEELGILGGIVLISLFLYFIWLGLKIANKSDDKFAKLTAIGISTWITFQAFINIMSSVGMFPLTGIPLPFFTYGGSHIITELAACGILLNISKHG